jgi:hypothetical protein
LGDEVGTGLGRDLGEDMMLVLIRIQFPKALTHPIHPQTTASWRVRAKMTIIRKQPLMNFDLILIKVILLVVA